MTVKKVIVIIICAVMISAFAACDRPNPADKKSDEPNTVRIDCTVTRDTKYNAAVFSVSPEEFEKAGFNLGDSCDVSFGNGFELTDIPFYNGYYVKTETPLIVAYPGFGTVSVTYNNMGIWDYANLTEGLNVSIKLNKAGKYSAVQEVLGQEYSSERSDYPSDEAFSNFRALSGGSLKQNFFYRGASPVDNSHKRAGITDGLLAENGIAFVVDLADSEEDIELYKNSNDFSSPHYNSLYEDGDVVLLDMSSAYKSPDYQKKLAYGFTQMMTAQGPVYIHCLEGKDRTGFVCMLLEALAGATYDEMLSDYMITYKNYYSVSSDTAPEKYDAIAKLYFDAFVCYLHDTEDMEIIKAADFTEDASDYLLQGGMSTEEITLLKNFIFE